MILVLNCGSQSIKWKVFTSPAEALAKAGQNLILIKKGAREVLNSDNYEKLLEEELNKISIKGISIIGHRVVHGGKKFISSIKITEENLLELEKLNHLAPLHNPYNILGIKTCQKIFQGIPQFAVFDTEFFKDLPEKAYTYALPKDISEKFGFRRYGFHGISHEFVASAAAKAMADKEKAGGKNFKKLKIITCHLGGGASITAIKNGKAIDTSMGFTPLEGLVMMTRPGNIDAGIVLELAKEFSIDKAREILNKESGVKGICGEEEMLKVLEILKMNKPAFAGASARQRKSKLAMDVFIYSIQKYIGAYYTILGGCDILVFTGAIGFGSEKIRKMIRKDLNILKTAKILAIETDEELSIAEKVLNIKY